MAAFVADGGHLVTFPEPVARHTDGRPLDGSQLWPHPVARASWHGRWQLIAHLIGGWMLPYYLRTRWKTARISPGALHLSDLIEPALVGQAAPLRSVTLDWVGASAGGAQDAGDTDGIRTVSGDFRLAQFREGGEVLLRRGGASAGYRAPVGRGTSTVVGTIPGGAYTTSRYYTLSPQDRLALRRFAVRLFEPAVPRRVVPSDELEVEAVARLSPSGGCLLFLVNRLGPQRGTICLPDPAALHLDRPFDAEVMFSAFGSQVTMAEGALVVDLAADDVVVVRLR